MVMGVLVTILAAAVQALNSFSFHFIWAFDYNGILSSFPDSRGFIACYRYKQNVTLESSRQ
jgi:hypothetical protein